MKRKILCNILLLLLFVPYSFAQTDSIAEVPVAKVSVYNGTQVKLDILSPAIVAGTSKGALQHYELGVNVRLAQRFYPTLELGYAGGSTTKGDSLAYAGHGGFFRVGVDICPLKKHPESPHALLVGVRLGTAVQEMTQTGSGIQNSRISGINADCWGEIVLGCQVEIAKVNNTAFYIGWLGRLKCLFTREPDGLPAYEMSAIYIPGFGNRNNLGWGVNYYLGWNF